MRCALAYAVAGSALAVISARADEQLPTINGTAYCTTTAELVDDEAFGRQCLDSEAKAEGHVRALWAETPDSVRTACVRELMLVTPSYQTLSTCMSTMVGDMWMSGELKVVPR
ncbi:hypothetical protein CIW48_29650 [Methylobacterium sp. P1-11]|nr:hypothetical protein CIW48_29650 [Methylobacterium sp. P1-11]